MTDNNEQETKRPLTLGRPGGSRLELRKPIETGQVRQSFPHGRSKTVPVEVRRKRVVPPGEAGGAARLAPSGGGATRGVPPGEAGRPDAPAPSEAAKPAAAAAAPAAQPARRPMVLPRGLTAEERAGRVRALKGAIRAGEGTRT